jgi:hypothetical protein
VKRLLRSVPEPPAGVFVLYRSRADERFKALAKCADVVEALAVEAACHAYESSIVSASAVNDGTRKRYEQDLAERKTAAVR